MGLDEYQEFITDLESSETASYVDLQYPELLEHGDMQECLEFINYLGKKMSENSGLAAKNPQLYDQYQTVWHILAFKAFPVLTNLDQQTLLQKRLLYAIQRGYNTDLLIAKYFDMYSSQILEQTFSSFAQDLEKNTEVLGSASIESDGNKFLPQIKNWLLDYAKFPTRNAKRGSIDRLNYSNESANLKTLSQGQRQTLLKVLKFYDDLKNAEPVVAPGEYSVSDSPVDLEKYAIKSAAVQHFPQNQSQGQSSVRSQPIQAQSIPRPVIQPTQRNAGIDIQKKLDELKTRTK